MVVLISWHTSKKCSSNDMGIYWSIVIVLSGMCCLIITPFTTKSITIIALDAVIFDQLHLIPKDCYYFMESVGLYIIRRGTIFLVDNALIIGVTHINYNHWSCISQTTILLQPSVTYTIISTNRFYEISPSLKGAYSYQANFQI